MVEIILPGTYVTVKDEALISAGRIASGIIGIVGTAAKGEIDKVNIIGSFSEALEIFGGTKPDDELTLIRSLEQIYNNGGRTVYAVRTGPEPATTKPADQTQESNQGTQPPQSGARSIDDETNTEETYDPTFTGRTADQTNPGTTNTQTTETPQPTKTAKDYYTASLAKLENEPVNIVLLAGQDAGTPEMVTILGGHLKNTAGIKRERIGIIGSSSGANIETITKHDLNNDRLIFVAPGLKSSKETLSGAYLAAAVAGLIASLPVQASPTNKSLAITGLSDEFTSSQLEALVGARVLAVEKREGFRIVKGITTSTNTAWHQITTRRIVDFAVYGVRSACDPYIGKLNNERVRGAMKATIDAFLTRMVQDEALISYELTVTATRNQEIDGEAIVTMTVRPTFSIDFIKVTMYLG